MSIVDRLMKVSFDTLKELLFFYYGVKSATLILSFADQCRVKSRWRSTAVYQTSRYRDVRLEQNYAKA